jgi:hypothetical protein
VTLSPTRSRTGSPILFLMENPTRLITSITKIAWIILLMMNANINLSYFVRIEQLGALF